MVRRLSVSVAIIFAAIPLRAVKLSRKQGDLAGRNEIQLAVPVEISRRDGLRVRADR